jgi:hypothetical protein
LLNKLWLLIHVKILGDFFGTWTPETDSKIERVRRKLALEGIPPMELLWEERNAIANAEAIVKAFTTPLPKPKKNRRSRRKSRR